MAENDAVKPDEPDATVALTDLDDTIVMMDVDEGQYYELDPVGARIWGLLETGRSADICDTLAAEFAVDPDTCRRDTLEFLQAASAMRIVHVQPARTPPALHHGEDVGDAG